MIDMIVGVVRLIADALQGRKTDAEVARGLIQAAFDTGVPHAVLAQYLSDVAAERADLAADLAQLAKVHGVDR